jgi:O-antigen ligase
MITKSTIVAIVAVLVGSASVALADNSQFDVNISRPAIQHSPLGAFAQSPSTNWGNGGTGVVKGYSTEEKLMFERAQGAAD